MILRTPIILGVCWWIGINTAIPFRINPENVKQDTRQMKHLLEDEKSPKHFYQPPKRDKSNHEFGPEFRMRSDYNNEYQPIEDIYYDSKSSEIYPDNGENYPDIEKTSHDVHKSSKKLIFPNKNIPNFRKISQDYSSPDVDQTSDSTEDYSQDVSYYSNEDANPEDSTTSAPENSTTSATENSTTSTPEDLITSAPENSKTSSRKASPDPEIEAHPPEKNVIENWIPTNCSRSTRKSSDRYSSSFLSNNTRDGLNEHTFPNPGEAEAVKRSSVFVGEDVTLCWIETITIKEDKSIQPPKKVVLREFTISFENSATIPEKYLECGKLEGEVEPGCHAYGGKSGFFDVIDEDSKVSKLVNFTTVSNKGNIEVRQHRNVRCAVGPVVTKNVIEFKDGSKNPKKRVEVKVSPRLRRTSEVGETCPSDQEKIDVPPKIKPAVKELSENREESKGKSDEFGKIPRKPDGGPEKIGEKPEEREEKPEIEERPGGIHENPEKRPDLIDKKPEEEPHFITETPMGKHPASQSLKKFGPTTMEESTPHSGEEDEEGKPIGKIADGSSITSKNEITEVENPSFSESPETSEGVEKNREGKPNPETLGGEEESCEGKSCKSERTAQLPKYTNTREALEPSAENKNTSKETTIPEEAEPKEGEGREPKSESCEGDSCAQCSTEGCPTDSQSIEESTRDKSVPDKPNEDISREDKVTESFIGKQTSAPEIDDAYSRDSTTEESPTDGMIPADRKPSVDTETANNTATEKHKEDKENESCFGENCSTKIYKSRTEGPTTDKLENETKEIPIPSDESGFTSSSSQTNQESENDGQLCKGDCSTASTKPSSKVDEEKMETGAGKSRKSTTGSRPNEEERPSKKELISFPKSRKSSSRNIHPSDVETESTAPDIQESNSEKSEGHPTSLLPWKDETNVPDSWEEDGTKNPKRISPHNLTRMEGPEKDFKCESGSCFTSLEGFSESPEGTSKSPEAGKESNKGGQKSSLSRTEPSDDVSEPEGRPKFPEDTSKAPESSEESLESPESISKSPEDTSKQPESSEESSDSPEDTTKSFGGITISPKDTLKSTENPDDISKSTEDVLKPETTTEPPESGTKYSKTTSEPEEIAAGTSRDLEKTSPFPRPENAAEKKHNKKGKMHEPDDNDDMESTYSDEEEPSHTPSFVKITISPSEEQPRDFTERSDSELKNRSRETILDRVFESTTDMSLIDRTTPECSPDDAECNSKRKTSSSEPVSKNKNVKKGKKIHESTISNHRLGLRIKILLEHIDEDEERKNLVEVDKHLLLNEVAKDHDNNTILNQIKALNDSVTAQTIKALLNCSTLEKLTKKGISIEVDEAALVSKGKKGSKNLEPNELILNVEDKGSKGEEVAKLRKKREYSEDGSKYNNSTTVNFTEENITDANTADHTSTVENSEETTTEANHTEVDDTNKNQSETIKDYLSDLKEDINTGINHVISKLKNFTTSNCSQESADVKLLPISNILGLISDPQNSRINSRNKRDAENYRKRKNSFNKLDNWSNERIKRAAGGNRLRSLTEFTIFRET